MFHDFRDDWNMEKLWMLFKKYGTVFDIFMVRKKLRNRQRYRYMRFKNIVDLEKMTKSLENIRIGSEMLLVHKAHDRRPVSGCYRNHGHNGGRGSRPFRGNFNEHIGRDSRKYSEVVLGNGSNKKTGENRNNTCHNEDVIREQRVPFGAIDIAEEDIESNLLKKCLIGMVNVTP